MMLAFQGVLALIARALPASKAGTDIMILRETARKG
jgi:hypothetical protein